MPRLLKDLLINDVSSVDRGAGEGVQVLLMKRKFDSDQRDKDASSGKAMPDGSFPIENTGDLKNAIRAIGRAKNPAKAKAHIKARAKALGAESELPDDWKKRDDDNVIDFTALRALAKEHVEKDGAVDFDDAMAADAMRDATDSMMCKLNEAICALNCSVCSIMWDADVVDKVGSVNESFSQFIDYVGTIKPETMEKTAMSPEIKKAIEDAVGAVAKPLQDQVAKLELENSVLKLSPSEFAFIEKASDDDKKKFAAKSKEDRAKDMDAAKKSAETTLPPEVQKRLEQADRDSAIVKKLQEDAEIRDFEKKAEEIGLKGKGEILRKAQKGDATAWADLEKMLGEMSGALKGAQKLSKAFDEIGGADGGNGGATPYDQLMSKARELRKADPKLTEAQAFDKVYTDPANADLAKAERDARLAKIYKVAS